MLTLSVGSVGADRVLKAVGIYGSVGDWGPGPNRGPGYRRRYFLHHTGVVLDGGTDRQDYRPRRP